MSVIILRTTPHSSEPHQATTLLPQLAAWLEAGIQNKNKNSSVSVVKVWASIVLIFTMGLLTIGIMWSPAVLVYFTPLKLSCHSVISTTLFLLSTNTGVAVFALVPLYLVVICNTVLGM